MVEVANTNLVYVYNRAHDGQLVLVDSYRPKDEQIGAVVEESPLKHSLWTVGLIASSLLIAVMLQAVMVVWSVMGATVCFMVAFVLPTSYYLKLAPNRSGTMGAVRRGVARFLLGLSLLACVGCTTITIMKVIDGTHSCPKWS